MPARNTGRALQWKFVEDKDGQRYGTMDLNGPEPDDGHLWTQQEAEQYCGIHGFTFEEA